jgi:MscS family membrane protein
MNFRYFLFLMLLIAYQGNAQNASYSLESPYQSLSTHIRYLEDDNYKPEIASQVFNPKMLTGQEAKKLATQLLQIYKGAGILIDYSKIPAEPNYMDSISGRHIYVIDSKYPQIYLEKQGNMWFYSEETAESIDVIHKEVYPFGADKLLELLPKLGNSKYVGLYLWQLIFILIIIILSLVIHKLFTLIIENIIIRILVKKGRKDVCQKLCGTSCKADEHTHYIPHIAIADTGHSIAHQNKYLCTSGAEGNMAGILYCCRIQACRYPWRVYDETGRKKRKARSTISWCPW